MSWRIEQSNGDTRPSIVISGFEDGVADDPFGGISKIRGMNIISTPKEAITLPRVTNVAPYPCVLTVSSVNTGADTITFTNPESSGTISRFMAGQFTTTGTLPTGISPGTTYWLAVSSFSLQSAVTPGVSNLSKNFVFKVYTSPFCSTGSLVNITGAGSGTITFTTIDMAGIVNFERNYGFALDANGRVWAPLNPFVTNRGYSPYYNQFAAYPGMYVYMGNDVSNITTGSCNGSLSVYRGSGANYYLFLFKGGEGTAAKKIDYTRIPDILSNDYTSYTVDASTWVTNWDPVTGSGGSSAVFSVNGPHQSLVGTDNVIYITDGTYIVSLYEKSGQTFDPTTTTTYTYNPTALSLPRTETAQCIEELGTNLYIGGAFRYIYPWDRISTSFNYPIVCVEQNIQKMVVANSNLYVFAGFRGRIYVSNGSQLQLFNKVPDHYASSSYLNSGLSTSTIHTEQTSQDPTITFTDCTIFKNQLYFCCNSYNINSQLESYLGLFAIDLETNAFRATFPSSASTNASNTTSPSTVKIYAYPNTTSVGSGLAIAWTNQDTGTVGIDWSNDTRYWVNSNVISVGRVETDIIPIGTFLNKRTIENIEFKLAQPLVANERCSINMRSNINSTYNLVGITTWQNLNGETAGTTRDIMSDVYTLSNNTLGTNTQNLQWIQLMFVTYPNTNIYYDGNTSVTVTNGSAVVTGLGTNWTSVLIGSLFTVDTVGGSKAYLVNSIDSSTQLTLASNYEGITGSGKIFKIEIPQSGIRLTELRIR